MAAIGFGWKGNRKVSDIRRFKIVLLAPSFLGIYPQTASERPNVCRKIMAPHQTSERSNVCEFDGDGGTYVRPLRGQVGG